MKILSVTIIPPSENAEWWRIINIANGLKSRGAEVDIVHYIIKGFYAHEIMKGKIYNNYENSIKIASPITILFEHLINLYHKKYDVVYGNTFGGAFFSILGKLSGIPLILDMHGIYEEFLIIDSKPAKLNLFLMKFMESTSLYFSDKVICVSRGMINYLHKEKEIPLKKLVYAANGVDLDFFKLSDLETIQKLKVSLGIENVLIFGYIGGFQNYQGVDNFIKAARKIDSDKIKFLVVGGDSESRENNIIFIPKIAREQIPDYYSLCDVLVLPRPHHVATEVAAPTKFAEYCAMGKPVLTTDVGDAADLVRIYKNGIVIEDNSPENLKKGVLKFSELDSLTFLEMGVNSRKLAEKEFDWKTISSNLVNNLSDFVYRK